MYAVFLVSSYTQRFSYRIKPFYGKARKKQSDSKLMKEDEEYTNITSKTTASVVQNSPTPTLVRSWNRIH